MSAGAPTTSPVPFVSLAHGRYVLGEQIGEGGMARVFSARDTKLDRPVAVKIYRAPTTDEIEAVRQEREIAVLASMSHPHVIAVLDAGWVERGSTRYRFVVMELARGTNLADRIEVRRGKTPRVRESLVVAAHIASALAFVHERGVVHRDIKPENIVVSDSTAPSRPLIAKLIDFGVAQSAGEKSVTQTSRIMGTAAYIAPEQVSGTGAVAASDVYALGLVLLETLTGVREFRGTLLESALARLSRDPEVPTTLPADVREIIIAMTARDAADRPSAREIAPRLRAAAAAIRGRHVALGASAEVTADASARASEGGVELAPSRELGAGSDPDSTKPEKADAIVRTSSSWSERLQPWRRTLRQVV
ncbi:serine/threonine-protein kinase [Agromyces atrinae]